MVSMRFRSEQPIETPLEGPALIRYELDQLVHCACIFAVSF